MNPRSEPAKRPAEQKRFREGQKTPRSQCARPGQDIRPSVSEGAKQAPVGIGNSCLLGLWGLFPGTRGRFGSLEGACPGSEPLFPPPGAHLCGHRGGVRHRGRRQSCRQHRPGGGPARRLSLSRSGRSSHSSSGVAGTCNLGGPSCAGPAASLPPPRRGASHSHSASCRAKGRSKMTRGPAPPQVLARASGEALGRTREARVHAPNLVGTWWTPGAPLL